MRPISLAFFAVASLIAFGSFAQTTPPGSMPSIALPPELDRVLRDYERAWTQNEPAAIAALFTADGMALPNGNPAAQGAAQIAAAYAKGAGSPLALRALAYSASQDMAYIVGGFSSARDKPDFGKFVLVLRRAPDGSWKIAADMDNANSRPRQAPPAQAQPSPPATAPQQ